MNIFYLDHDYRKCAEFLHDTHTNTMLKELTQILSTAVWVNNCDYAETQYGKEKLCAPTHTNHPCCVWVRTSYHNFLWSLNLLYKMNSEWYYRRGKNHGSWLKCWDSLLRATILVPFEHNSFTPPPLCMPEKYHTDDVVKSYRWYYNCEKQYDKNGKFIGKYTKRSAPYWMMKYEA